MLLACLEVRGWPLVSPSRARGGSASSLSGPCAWKRDRLQPLGLALPNATIGVELIHWWSECVGATGRAETMGHIYASESIIAHKHGIIPSGSAVEVLAREQRRHAAPIASCATLIGALPCAASGVRRRRAHAAATEQPRLRRSRQRLHHQIGDLVYVLRSHRDPHPNSDNPGLPDGSGLWERIVGPSVQASPPGCSPASIIASVVKLSGAIAPGARQGGARAQSPLILASMALPQGCRFPTPEDEWGLINVIVRPDVAERYGRELRGGPILWAEGLVQRRDSAPGQICHFARIAHNRRSVLNSGSSVRLPQ